MNPTHSIRRNMLAALAIALVGSVQAAPTGPEGPEELVKATTQDVLAVIGSTNDRQRLEQEAATKVVPHFDFRRMTQLAVGRYWRQATPEQQQALESQFHNLMVRTYVNALAATKKRHATVEMLPTKAPSGAEVTVRSRVVPSGGEPIEIDYQLEKDGQDWKVFDVIVANMSLVTNYRGTFAEEIEKSGIDGLIKTLAAKNKTLTTKG